MPGGASPRACAEFGRVLNQSAPRPYPYGMVDTMAVQAGELVQAAAMGDEAAFTELVARHHRDMLRVAYVICRDAALAEDSAQSAWAIAWRRIGDVRDPSKVRGWLVTVAANEARRTMRSRRPHVARDLGRRHRARRGAGPAIGPPGRRHRHRRPAARPRDTRSDRPGPDRPALRRRAQLRRDRACARDVLVRRPRPSFTPAASASWRTSRCMNSTSSSDASPPPFVPTPTESVGPFDAGSGRPRRDRRGAGGVRTRSSRRSAGRA